MERRGFFAAFFGSLVALVTGGRVKAARPLSRMQRMAREINRRVPPRLYADRFGREQVRELIREIDEAVDRGDA